MVTIAYTTLIIVFCITRYKLIMLLLGKSLHYQNSVNLIPFHNILWGIEKYGKLSWDMRGNIVMFIPLGIIYCYYLQKSSYFKKMILCFLSPIVIELFQYILKTGTTDIDDVIMNTIGAWTGVGIYALLAAVCRKIRLNTKDVVSVCTSIFPPFLLFYVADYFGISVYQFAWWKALTIILYYAVIDRILLRDLTTRQRIRYYLIAFLFGVCFFSVLMRVL
ncbi:MAG: VanZ family protein [Acetanaerobacterium sp.]